MTEATRQPSGGDRLRQLSVLRRGIVVILACTVLVPAAALAFSLTRPNQYTATATLLFKDQQVGQQVFGNQSAPPSSDPARAAATNKGLVSLDVTAQAAARKLPGLSPGRIRGSVAVTQAAQSDLVGISAVDEDPKLAARIANAFAQSFITVRRGQNRTSITEARHLVEKQVASLQLQGAPRAQISRLQQNAQQLGVLAALQTGDAQLVQPAETPAARTSPRPLRDAVLGVVLGFVLGVAVVFIFDRFDKKLRAPGEAEEAFARPVLGHIPVSRTLGPRSVPSAGEVESFLLLRANLRYFNVDRQIRSIVVTSAASGEGKTTIAWNLALAASYSEQDVLLIEADLRKPSLSLDLGTASGARHQGLSDVLAGVITLEEAVQRIPFGGGENGAGPPRTVGVLVAGTPPPNPGELLESERMGELLEEAARGHSLVIVDTPPIAIVSDAIPLLRQVGGTIVVARMNQTSRHALDRLNSQLAQLGIVPLGVVVNSVSARQGYGYGYGYGYGKGANPLPGSGDATTGSSAPAPVARTTAPVLEQAQLAAQSTPIAPAPALPSGSPDSAVAVEPDSAATTPSEPSPGMRNDAPAAHTHARSRGENLRRRARRLARSLLARSLRSR